MAGRRTGGVLADGKKKPRFEDDEEEQEQDDEEYEESAATPSRRHMTSEEFQRQKSQMDALSSDEEEEEEDGAESGGENANAENENARRVANVPALPQIRKSIGQLSGDCGTIKKIELWDFMCHKRLEVDFGPCINFISGGNGSGKSAIVNALQICLGMKAMETGRAQKNQDMIRDGADGDAKIHVHIANEGIQAYYPEKYGKFIIVERVLKRNGTATSRIINGQTKQTVCTKKRDVEQLAEAFSLHVDNPCCILDQESAKQFLKGSSTDKYEFFLRATDLSTIMNEFTAEMHEKEKAKAEMARQLTVAEHHKKALQEAEREWKNVQELRDLDAQLKEAEVSIMWAIVRDRKEEADRCKTLLTAAEQDLVSKRQKQANAEQEASEMTSGLNELKSGIATKKDEIEVIKTEIESAKRELKEQSAPMRRLKIQLEQKKVEEKGILDEKQGMQANVDKLMKKIASSGSSLEKLNAELEKKKAELDGLSSEQTVSFEDVAERKEALEQSIQACKMEMETSRKKHQTLQAHLEGLKSDLHTATVAAASTTVSRFAHLGKFHQWVPKVMEDVAANPGKFSKPPLFVGQHVRLTDQDYLCPVETVTASTLQSFLVNSAQDEQKLREFAVKAGARAHDVAVYVRPFTDQKFQVSKPSADWKSMLDVLEINDPNVYNTLVDVNRLESLVLIKDKNESSRFYTGPPQDSKTPPNTIAAYDMNGDSYTVKGGSRLFESSNRERRDFRLLVEGGQTVDFIQEAKKRKEELAAKIEKLTRDVVQAKEEINSHTRQFDQFNKDLVKLAEEESSYTERAQKLTQKKIAGEEAISKLMEKMSEISSGRDSQSIQVLRENMLALDADLQEARSNIVEDEKSVANFQRDTVAPLEARVAELTEELKKKMAEAQDIDNKLGAFSEDFKPINHKLEKTKREVIEAEKKNEVVKQEFEKLQQAVEKGEESALQGCGGQRVEVQLRTADIRKKIQNFKAAIEQEHKRAEASGETVEERLVRVETARARAKTNYQAIKGDLSLVQNRIKFLKRSMKLRKSRFTSFREHAEQTTKELFSELLRQKGHDGTVKFSHDERTIDIHWYRKKADVGTSTQPDDHDESDNEDSGAQSGAFTDAKALSGGERSTTTLALLLALGRSVESPIRVMDEFDVFMDAGARKIAIQQLVKDSRFMSNSVRKQCIFLTPLDISSIPDASDIRKQKIQPNAGYKRSENTTGTLDSVVQRGSAATATTAAE